MQSRASWSGTEFEPGRKGWFFRPNIGTQRSVIDALMLYAVAVRPGDVAAAVPEPQTLALALALLALGATVVVRRRRPR